MSYPLQPYHPNHRAIAEQPFSRPIIDGNHDINNLLGSFLGLANQLMTDILCNGPGIDGISPFMGADPNNPHANVIGMTAMKVTQIACGPDGRPHIIQAHDERCLGPGGIWQTKKALRDPERGIDKMQIGYFAGDRSEIVEHQFDLPSRQCQQQVQPQRAVAPNVLPFPHQWRMQSQQATQRQPPLLRPQPYQYYQPQQQLSSYAQRPLQALPAPSSYPHF